MSEPELQNAEDVAEDDRFPAGMTFIAEEEAAEEESEESEDGYVEIGEGCVYIALIDELLEDVGAKGFMVREGATFVLLAEPYRWVNIEKLEQDRAEQAKLVADRAKAAEPKKTRGKVTPLRETPDK